MSLSRSSAIRRRAGSSQRVAIGSRPLARGQVGKNVQDSRHRRWQPVANFPDLAALNAWLEQRCVDLWRDIPHGVRPGTIAGVRAGVRAEEPAALMPLPPAFDGLVAQSKRVSPTCLISFDRNRYSVPASFANRPVSLRHCLAVIQPKPGALRNGAPFVELPKAFRQLQDQMMRKPGASQAETGKWPISRPSSCTTMNRRC